MTKERAKVKAGMYLEWADKAEAKSKELLETFHTQYKDFDWTQPILIGHHSQRRHEKVFEHRDSVMRRSIELDAKAKRFREKAENLLQFANTNKGDAERKRQAKREEVDAIVKVGMYVDSCMYGVGEVLKVNQKTYTMRFPSGFKTTIDKSWIRLPSNI